MVLRFLIFLPFLFFSSCNVLEENTELLEPIGVGPQTFEEFDLGFVRKMYPRLLKRSHFHSERIDIGSSGQIFLLLNQTSRFMGVMEILNSTSSDVFVRLKIYDLNTNLLATEITTSYAFGDPYVGGQIYVEIVNFSPQIELRGSLQSGPVTSSIWRYK